MIENSRNRANQNHDTAIQRVDMARSPSVGSLDILPLELWHEIFDYVCFSNEEFSLRAHFLWRNDHDSLSGFPFYIWTGPLKLTHVSSTWRRIASNTSCLWSSIFVDLGRDLPDGVIPLIELFLRNSSSSSKRIKVMHSEPEYHAPNIEVCIQIMRLLYAQTPSCHNLTFGECESAYTETPLDLFFEQNPSVKLQSLRKFQLLLASDRHPRAQVAPHLIARLWDDLKRSTFLRHVSLDTNMHLPFRDATHITSLKFGVRDSNRAHGIADILHSCPNLTTLWVSVKPLNTIQTPMPHSQHRSIYKHHSIKHLTFEPEFEKAASDMQAFFDQFEFPNLNIFDLILYFYNTPVQWPDDALHVLHHCVGTVSHLSIWIFPSDDTFTEALSWVVPLIRQTPNVSALRLCIDRFEGPHNGSSPCPILPVITALVREPEALVLLPRLFSLEVYDSGLEYIPAELARALVDLTKSRMNTIPINTLYILYCLVRDKLGRHLNRVGGVVDVFERHNKYQREMTGMIWTCTDMELEMGIEYPSMDLYHLLEWLEEYSRSTGAWCVVEHATFSNLLSPTFFEKDWRWDDLGYTANTSI